MLENILNILETIMGWNLNNIFLFFICIFVNKLIEDAKELKYQLVSQTEMLYDIREAGQNLSCQVEDIKDIKMYLGDIDASLDKK